MEIRSIEPVLVTYPFEREPLSYCYVRVEADGLVGWGEACDSFGCTYAGIVGKVVEDAYAPLVVGQELVAVEPLAERMRLFTRRRLGDQWVAVHARSAVETALWDLFGKAQGRSVSSLIGQVRDRVAVYASHTFLEEGDPAWHLELLAPVLARGVKMVKVRIGPEWREDLAVLAAVRAGLPGDVEMTVDGSEIFTVPTALEVAAALSDLGVRWFEEPVPQVRRRAIDELVRRSPVAIAYGEHLFGLDDAIDMLERGPIGVLQPDAATCGGIGPARAMAQLAAAYGARVAMHHAAGPVSLAANLHVAATVHGVQAVEYSHVLRDGWEVGTGAAFGIDAIRDGCLDVPDAPGLGVGIDEELAAKYPYGIDPTRVAGSKGGLPDRFVGDR
ncbi:MAG TPA: mandelate racemase/muconate lactonizing enzyme family protein [Acidimicrobiales bacterium]|nr:mandelate racemase/muconate lactonizing enzyme family protein [Acidimicrobiales bacterium]